MDEELAILVGEFLVESRESLDRLDRDFVSLEQNPQDQSLLASIFRVVHTIKGACGFLGFAKLEKVTHVGESLLGKLRDGKILLNSERTNALLALVDAIRQMLDCIESDKTDGENEYLDLVAQLGKLQEEEIGQEASNNTEVIEVSTQHAESEVISETFQCPIQTLMEEAPSAVSSVHQETLPSNVVEETKESRSSISAFKPESSQNNIQASASSPNFSNTANVAAIDTTIRVDVALLDKLMNLVGELVLSRNQALQHTVNSTDSNIVKVTQKISLITSELQEGIMKTRMQPIGNVWGKFPRIVRDLASSCGKKVRLEMQGKETELDKTLIEAIKDPLTHILRNSVDHGIETPDTRAEKGKPEEGVLKLQAFHEGGQVNIVIEDDGAGISTTKLKEKAISKNLITEDQASRMGEKELLNLIFLPGFSTAEKITNVSGRGVGMDVVRTNIENINGSVEIQSKVGVGTTLKIKIPLTLAIIPALIVTSGKNRYAIPQVSLVELVRSEVAQAKKNIQLIQGAPVYRLRGNLLPLVYLDRELQINHEAFVFPPNQAVNIVILQAEDHRFGLVVDEISDTQEIVVKPLHKLINNIQAYSGATIMGDGKVALILDVLGLAQKAHLIAQQTSSQYKVDESTKNLDGEKHILLIVKAGHTPFLAIPLHKINRIEEFDPKQVEKAGDFEVIQYRSQIMPLLRIADLIPERRKSPRNEEESMMCSALSNGLLQVVVCNKNGRSIGLVVDEVYDAVEEVVNLQSGFARDGVIGSSVIQGKVTEILDADRIVAIGLASSSDDSLSKELLFSESNYAS